MKALTIKQPWASLITTGAKTVELRTWRTSYRGTLVIHAGAAWDKRGDRVFDVAPEYYSAIVGTAFLYEITQAHAGMYRMAHLSAQDMATLLEKEPVLYAWHLRDPVRFTPLPFKGRLGLWDAPAVVPS